LISERQEPSCQSFPELGKSAVNDGHMVAHSAHIYSEMSVEFRIATAISEYS